MISVAIDIGLEQYELIIPSHHIKNTKVNQSIDVTSASLPISTFSFDVVGYDIESELEEVENFTGTTYKIEQNLPVYVIKSIKTIMRMYVKSFQKTGKNVYHFETYDYIGKLDTEEFYGEFYELDTFEYGMNRLLQSNNWAGDDYYTDNDLKIAGFTKFSNKREALKNMIFAAGGAIIPNSGINVYVKKLEAYDPDIEYQTVEASRLINVQIDEKQNAIKNITLNCKQYISNLSAGTNIESEIVYDTYGQESEVESDIITIKFDRPIDINNIILNDKIIYDPDPYFEGYGAAFLEFSVEDVHQIVVLYVPYAQFTRKYYATDATDSVNVDVPIYAKFPNSEYSKWYGKMLTQNLGRKPNIKARIVEGKHESVDADGNVKIDEDSKINLGDIITLQTGDDLYGNVTGRVVSQSYNLNGNIIVKDVEMIQYA